MTRPLWSQFWDAATQPDECYDAEYTESLLRLLLAGGVQQDCNLWGQLANRLLRLRRRSLAEACIAERLRLYKIQCQENVAGLAEAQTRRYQEGAAKGPRKP